MVAVAVLVGSGCGDSGGEDTGSEQSSTTAAAVSAEESTTSIEPEETTTSSSSVETETETGGDAVGIGAMAPSEVEELIERIGCEIDPEFGHGSGMVAFFLGGYGPGGDPPVDVDAETSFLCGTGGDLTIIGLALNDAGDARTMAEWLARNDSGFCREIGFAGSWTFLYATSDTPPDAVRLPDVMALYGGQTEVACPFP